VPSPPHARHGPAGPRIDPPHKTVAKLARYPQRLERESLYRVAYPLMLLARRLDERLVELYRKGYVKGTVTTGVGNEATAIGMAIPFRPGRDVASLLHRDLGSHLVWGSTPYQLLCQYMANADSPTHAREGNAHHGDAAKRRFPMISHLGQMLSLVVGGTWAARRNKEHAFGLAVIGDGGTSKGDFHESLNLASVHKVPVLFLIENNYYAFSTPTTAQYRCQRLSDRAQGYGISGRTIDGTDVWEVYSAVCDMLEAMASESLPAILECMTLRLQGHAVYDKGEYVSEEQMREFLDRDPLPRARRQLLEVCGVRDAEVAHLEAAVEEEVREAVARAMVVGRPLAPKQQWDVYDVALAPPMKPVTARKVKNGDAVRLALDYILSHCPEAFLAGLDIGVYGSAFKTCKGLIDRFGADRVIDMPISESGIMGFALGASQIGARPIIEFQFADFSTEAVTQLGLNAGTWYFRSGSPAPLLVRLPCGGGLTMGAFHSGEFEGLWSRFPGLKLLYPATPQETFEALVAGFYDPNPCVVLEHKLLYWSKIGEIDFDGDLESAWRARRYVEGDTLTLVAFGAMVHEAIAAAEGFGRAVEVWNPFVLQPMDLAPIIDSVRNTGRLLVVQECGATQGLGNHVISWIVRHGGMAWKCRPRLVAAPDVPVPFAPELEGYYRPNATRISAAIEQMLGES
jgi:2-oxoisovalerate dehydrogenase E1 component